MSAARVALSVLTLVSLFAARPAFAQPAPAAAPAPIAPLYVVTHVDFIPRNAPVGERALRQYALDSRKEPGSVRCEVVQEAGQPNHFILIEVWKDRPAYDAHLGSAVTRAFRDTLQPLIGSPYDVRLGRLEP